jgi:hypothetical protein
VQTEVPMNSALTERNAARDKGLRPGHPAWRPAW